LTQAEHRLSELAQSMIAATLADRPIPTLIEGSFMDALDWEYTEWYYRHLFDWCHAQTATNLELIIDAAPTAFIHALRTYNAGARQAAARVLRDWVCGELGPIIEQWVSATGGTNATDKIANECEGAAPFRSTPGCT
jgi:hypothetical protein